MQAVKRSFSLVLAALALSATAQVWAHGDVTPQEIDISGLEPIKDSDTTFADNNPYSGNPRAIEIGKHAFAQNCARCHGIDAISGGIAPDLRVASLFQAFCRRNWGNLDVNKVKR